MLGDRASIIAAIQHAAVGAINSPVEMAGRVDPVTAAAAAAELGIRIYTIGIGTQGEARLPIGRGPEGQLRYEMMPVEIDEDVLRDVSASTGGRYFRATDSEALGRIFFSATPAMIV